MLLSAHWLKWPKSFIRQYQMDPACLLASLWKAELTPYFKYPCIDILTSGQLESRKCIWIQHRNFVHTFPLLKQTATRQWPIESMPMSLFTAYCFPFTPYSLQSVYQLFPIIYFIGDRDIPTGNENCVTCHVTDSRRILSWFFLI